MGEETHLVIAIGGWGPDGRIRGTFVATLRKAIPQSRVWVPDLNLPMFSAADPEEVSGTLFKCIDDYLAGAPELATITLLGYSAGSLLARRVFCMAHGADLSGEMTGVKAPWADRIRRIVALAGITRGWEFSTASPAQVRFFAPILYALARFVTFFWGLAQRGRPGRPFIWGLQRGSPFVVSTRIQYVNVIERLRRQSRVSAPQADDLTADGVPSTIFLLGARDEFISPADCSELGPRSEFTFIELPGCNHSGALQIEGDDDLSKSRRERVVAALSEDFLKLQDEPWVVRPSDIDDYLDPMDLARAGSELGREAAAVQHVVMVVHGIRDNGFWTKRVAREIKSLARQQNIEVRAPSPTYGYFSMWDFVKPGGRAHATRWFMERYADVRSHFPNAQVSFVGHSNGTYIAARALKLCPAVKLHRIVFAGSVVRCDYDWTQVDKQTAAVLNYIGSDDRVVAFLPAAFERLGLRRLDVGGAGAFGFEQSKRPIKSSVELHQVCYVEGGHGAAIEEGFWPEMARFVLLGEAPNRAVVRRREELNELFRFAPLATCVGIVLALLLLFAPIVSAVLVALLLKIPESEIFDLTSAVLFGLAISWFVGRFLRAW